MTKGLPLISIVTPSLNQGAYIEDTIKSVINQNYPNFEHIIIDGGSTDDTIDILRRYNHLIWISEKDRCQSEAINKGFKKAKGEIIGWLNSDDSYEPNAFFTVVKELNKAQGKYIVFGNCNVIDEKGEIIAFHNGKYRGKDSFIEYWNYSVPQPSFFFCRDIIYEIGLLNENLHYAMDRDFFLRAAEKYTLFYINKTLANFRMHRQSKSVLGIERFEPELYEISKRYWGSKYRVRYWLFYLSGHNYRSNIIRVKAYKMKKVLTIRDFRRLVTRSIFNNPLNLFRKKFISALFRAILGHQCAVRIKYFLVRKKFFG